MLDNCSATDLHHQPLHMSLFLKYYQSSCKVDIAKTGFFQSSMLLESVMIKNVNPRKDWLEKDTLFSFR